MLTRRRLIPFALLIFVLGGIGYTAWSARAVEQDLRAAESAVIKLQDAVSAGDEPGAASAADALQEAAAAAREGVDGPWWSLLSHMPELGDDVVGVRALSHSLDLLASEGVDPLLDGSESVDELVVDGRIDLDVASSLARPVKKSLIAAETAVGMVAELDSSSYVGRLRGRFDDYVARLESLRSGLASADSAVQLLPTMAGGEEQRRYLLVFQNNAEIRATGGLPGAFAEVIADNGRLSMGRQGTGTDLGQRETPVLPLSDAERHFYGEQLGTYFLDANFTSDFPRAAELMGARWEEVNRVELDGVIALDPVALSYMLNGTGPVDVGGRTFTSDNLVDGLLNEPYLTLAPEAQDRFFAQTARKVFDAITGEVSSPLELLKALQRSAVEGRLLVAPFGEAEKEALKGSVVLGELSGDDGSVPHVDVTLNDATGAKMSYYLRSSVTVRSVACSGRRQALSATMRLGSTINSTEARKLPDSITGGGVFGTDPGSQLVQVRIFGPYGGSVDGATLEGEELDSSVVNMDGRPAIRFVALLSSVEDLKVTWQMTSGPDQAADAKVTMSPGLVSGDKVTSARSSC
ncbi:DUF4012 domain-containing protein [Nocardioides pacificus]